MFGAEKCGQINKKAIETHQHQSGDDAPHEHVADGDVHDRTQKEKHHTRGDDLAKGSGGGNGSAGKGF